MSKIRHTPRAPTALRHLPAGSGVDAHRHDDHQIVYAGRGVLSVTTGAGTWIAPGTRALWIPAGIVHEHRAYGETDLHTVGVPTSENPLRLDSPAVLAVGPLLRELILACTRDEFADDAERRRLHAVLLDQLRRSSQQPIRLPSPRDPRLVAVCALLDEDPADQRTLTSLGAQVGASERTLSRLFRSEMRMTFPQWRTQLRLCHALRLLAEGEAVTSVAHRTGWSSASAFIEVFRRTFGHTPGKQPAGHHPEE
ncbi:AraC-type DNA-binding protein [Saccharopolyspora antimicrobica]|uniref:HTH-type transcriptional regulator RipA n=1 Tax=Saccharopolyspora antimicrobica TaxID=455193 RepID=A0A1I4QTA6_9PSEU|nr:helix-turn-helix transcriptional regulator [Saccharopolyspora antimicrobica]RKT88305.1 AraC family transcriptional regulator [Saccharopolyspora antimicrobica]SFM43271.1 AraC-type DNA-binding protein [Saccharopolyspora antimicrobica]